MSRFPYQQVRRRHLMRETSVDSCEMDSEEYGN